MDDHDYRSTHVKDLEATLAINLIKIFQHRLVGYVDPGVLNMIRKNVMTIHSYNNIAPLLECLHNALRTAVRIEMELSGTCLRFQVQSHLIPFDLKTIRYSIMVLRRLGLSKDVCGLIVDQTYRVNDFRIGYKCIFNAMKYVKQMETYGCNTCVWGDDLVALIQSEIKT